MRLPKDKPEMKIKLYGDGKNGAARQMFRNDRLGLQLDAVTEGRGKPWEENWSNDYLPNRYFKSYGELRDVMRRLNPARVVPATSIHHVDPKDPRNRGKCWWCMEREHNWTIWAQVGWRLSDVEMVPACDVCLPSVKARPRDAVARRVAYCATLPSPAEILAGTKTPEDPTEDIPF